MRGREIIVPGTGAQRLYLYLVNGRTDCAREIKYCPRYMGAEGVPAKRRVDCAREREYSNVQGTGEQRLYLVNRRADCAREREYCPRYRGAEAVPGK